MLKKEEENIKVIWKDKDGIERVIIGTKKQMMPHYNIIKKSGFKVKKEEISNLNP